MKGIVSWIVYALLAFLAVAVEAATDPKPKPPPKRLKIETTYTPPSCNRKARKSKTGDRLKVNYSGVYWKDPDLIIDSNFKSGKPYEFNVGLGQVIRGWDRGLTKMCVGEKRVLTIPGDQTNQGEPLIYSVELLSVDTQPASKSTSK